MDLAPVAHRAMGERSVDLGATADNITRYISLEMDRVPEADRARVAAIAHDALAAEMGSHVPPPVDFRMALAHNLRQT